MVGHLKCTVKRCNHVYKIFEGQKGGSSKPPQCHGPEVDDNVVLDTGSSLVLALTNYQQF